MTLPALLFAIRGILADTRAQARAAGITLGLATITTLCVVFCLSVGVHGETPQLPTQPWERPEFLPASEAQKSKLGPEGVREEGVDVPTGELSLFFGAVRVPLQRTSADVVRMIQMILAAGLADTLGVLLALVWTASFLPSFLEPAAASVLLVKPTSRWAILLGKCAGIFIAVAAQALLFVGATWLALAVKTGTWDVRYFMAVPVLLIHFGVFFTVSAVIAVYTRSAVACALGTLLAWGACCGVNLARHEVLLQSGSVPVGLETAYWLLPKPIDFNLLLAQSLNTADDFRAAVDVNELSKLGFFPEWSALTCLPFAGAMLVLAGWRLSRTDY